MIGGGKNKKSIAYVENLVDFILYSIKFPPGIHVYNYVDAPDLSMNELIRLIYHSMGSHRQSLFRIPYSIGYSIGMIFDIFSIALGRKLPISRMRVRKFCSNSIFSTKSIEIGFKPRFSLVDSVHKTVKYEYKKFLENKK
jgi:nucleoside-diphosphate-sugar epimerase